MTSAADCNASPGRASRGVAPERGAPGEDLDGKIRSSPLPRGGGDSRRQKAGRTKSPVAEIEIKLLCEPEVLQAAVNSTAVLRHARGSSKHTQLNAIYYDTPDCVLLQRKWALRVRSADGGQHTMTLKTPRAGEVTGVFARNEWNAPADGPDLDRKLLAQWFGEIGEKDVNIAALRPLFCTQVMRQTRKLHTPDGVIELAADSGNIIAGQRTLPVCEIEMELVSGSPDAIFALASTLLAATPLRLSVRSKGARGYDLALDRTPAAVKATPVDVSPEASLDTALHAALQSIFAHAMSNLEAAEEGSRAEGVHQLRVALRRLRSVLGVVKTLAPPDAPGDLRVDAKWLMSELGPARNWDVFASGILKEARGVCGAAIDFSVLEARVNHQRQAAQDRARAALLSPRSARFLVTMGGWISRRGWRDNASAEALAQLEAPARHFARRILRQRRRSVCRKGRGFRNLDATALHETRLALKKLRYTTEIFQPFLRTAHDVRQFARRLAKLQETFGHYNDLHAAAALVQQLRQHDPVAGPDLDLAIGAIIGWQAAERPKTLIRLQRQWKSFRTAARAGG